ncbi:hypothetical protein EV356DRAFT_528898 [Viridothelium virens]|uniref:Uncharacterized protein n=1 Tax=Viridothelium virens TaxID=1048519 RepID=A0A6A6HLM6_VIRVR|nr:hypothetical protein EV356DRAFT_528898 [Viridothelium virens]
MPIASMPQSLPSSGSPNGFTPSPTDSMLDIFPRYSSSTTSSGASCAFPSWPSGKALSSFTGSATSSFISDEDLFPEDLDSSEVDVKSATFLHEAPAPPRVPPFPSVAVIARPAPEKPKKRRRSSAKPKRPSKPMKTITETPEESE